MPETSSLPDDWTEPERWAWEQIRAGKIADFNERAKEGGGAAAALDPTSADGWSADRRLRASVLNHLLTDRSFVEATPFGGVRIRGALVDDAPIDLEHARLSHQFSLAKSRIETSIKARNLRVNGSLSFESSHVVGHLDLNGAKIDEQLSLAWGACFEGTVDLAGASVGGQLTMKATSFTRLVNLNSAKIAGAAFRT